MTVEKLVRRKSGVEMVKTMGWRMETWMLDFVSVVDWVLLSVEKRPDYE